MHSDELRKLNDAYFDRSSTVWKIIDELITRSDLHTAAIVAMNESDLDIADAEVKALVAHTAEPKKKKYTVEDIAATRRIGGWCVECDIYGWSGEVWLGVGAAFEYRSEHDAEAVATRLRATNNLPEEYK